MKLLHTALGPIATNCYFAVDDDNNAAIIDPAANPARIIEIIEKSMSSPVCELLKRPDENATVMNAHRKPVFVEDCVRNMMEMIAEKYSDLPDDTLITSRQENQESIHRHNAFAEKVTTMGDLKAELNL